MINVLENQWWSVTYNEMESTEKLSDGEATNTHERTQCKCLPKCNGAADTCRSSLSKVRWKTFCRIMRKME